MKRRGFLASLLGLFAAPTAATVPFLETPQKIVDAIPPRESKTRYTQIQFTWFYHEGWGAVDVVAWTPEMEAGVLIPRGDRTIEDCAREGARLLREELAR